MSTPKDKPTIDDLLWRLQVHTLTTGYDVNHREQQINRNTAKAALLSLLEGEAVTLYDYQEGSGYASRPAIPLSVVRELLKP